MALIYSWQTIADTQTDANSPINEVLMNSIRQDLIHLQQTVYGDGSGGFKTAVDGHDHDGSNSIVAANATNAAVAATANDVADGIITPAKLSLYSGAASVANTILFSRTEYATMSTSYVEAIKLQLARSGPLIIAFDLITSNSSYEAFAQIYRNGVAVGAEQVTFVASWTGSTKQIAIAGWSPNDALQLAIRTANSGVQASCRYLVLYADTKYHDQEVLSWHPTL